MSNSPLVSREEWTRARLELLAEEKAMSKALDALARKRRELPWVMVDKDYRFSGSGGEQSLVDLFAGHSQLVVYHFMYGPDWKQGYPSCSSWADSYNGIDIHLAHSYSCYGRGLDIFNGAYQPLDMTPKGRDEDLLPYPMAWLRRHDQYGE